MTAIPQLNWTNMRKGSIVTTVEETAGVITDYDGGYSAVLVKLTEGDDLNELDRSHGRWYEIGEVTDTGQFDGDALVWFAGRFITAGSVAHPIEF